MKDKIDEQILNSAGVGDTARVLKINKNAVISHLKKDSKASKSLIVSSI